MNAKSKKIKPSLLNSFFKTKHIRYILEKKFMLKIKRIDDANCNIIFAWFANDTIGNKIISKNKKPNVKYWNSKTDIFSIVFLNLRFLIIIFPNSYDPKNNKIETKVENKGSKIKFLHIIRLRIYK